MRIDELQKGDHFQFIDPMWNHNNKPRYTVTGYRDPRYLTGFSEPVVWELGDVAGCHYYNHKQACYSMGQRFPLKRVGGSGKLAPPYFELTCEPWLDLPEVVKVK